MHEGVLKVVEVHIEAIHVMESRIGSSAATMWTSKESHELPTGKTIVAVPCDFSECYC
jgi:hypothetical protein